MWKASRFQSKNTTFIERMLKLYELVKEAKDSNFALEQVVSLFEPKLKKSLSLTSLEYREDLAQELKYKLVKYIKDYDVDSTPGFWDFKNQITTQQ